MLFLAEGQGTSKVVRITFISCDLTGPLASTEDNFKGGKGFFSTIQQTKSGSIFPQEGLGRGHTDISLGKSLVDKKIFQEEYKAISRENKTIVSCAQHKAKFNK